MPSPIDRASRYRRQCEALRVETRRRLTDALRDLIPGVPVVVFGSLIRCGGYRQNSDVDIALWEEPAGRSRYGLASEIEERTGRPIDLVILPESRLREKILSDGEVWTNSR